MDKNMTGKISLRRPITTEDIIRKMKKETMTRRQRVLAALNHEPLDRFPIDFGMHYSTGISAFAYRDLREHLGLPVSPVVVPDPWQFLARVDEDVLKRFHIDTMLLHPGYKYTSVWKPRGKYEFVIPRKMAPVLQPDGGWLSKDGAAEMRMPDGGFFFDGWQFNVDEEDGDEMLRRFGAEAEHIYNETDYFTMHIGFFAYGAGDMEFSCKMLTDPDEAMEQIKGWHNWQMTNARKIIETYGKHIQGVCIAGDLGTQTAPFMAPSLYEEMIHPYMKELVKFIKNNSDYKVFMHSCGAVKRFIPYFIDEEIDALNPVQVSAADMDPATLKKEFGGKIAFWGGGCDTQRILNLKGPREVRENVKALTQIFKQNSSFIFNQVHNIMGNVKPENIVAMFDTAYENSFYI